MHRKGDGGEAAGPPPQRGGGGPCDAWWRGRALDLPPPGRSARHLPANGGAARLPGRHPTGLPPLRSFPLFPLLHEACMTDTIRLGGRDFTLRPPTLGQLRHLLHALAAIPGASGGALSDAAARLVAAGLAAAHPELTTNTVLDLEASLAELNAAVAAILDCAGLSPKESPLGEAEPRVTPGEMRTGAPDMMT